MQYQYDDNKCRSDFLRVEFMKLFFITTNEEQSAIGIWVINQNCKTVQQVGSSDRKIMQY